MCSIVDILSVRLVAATLRYADCGVVYLTKTNIFKGKNLYVFETDI